MITLNALPDHEVVVAQEADVEALSQIIASAFHSLAPSRWLIADPAVRRAVFPGYFRLYVELAMMHGIVHTIPDRTAAALWLPVDADGAGKLPDYDSRLAEVTGLRLNHFVAFDKALEDHYPRDFAHHHLAILGVRPDRQGQGIGSTLLRAHHHDLDQAGLPAYLQASDLDTRKLYIRHGYVDHGPPIFLPGGGPMMYPMMRRARLV